MPKFQLKRIVAIAAVLTVCALLVRLPVAHADRVEDLTKTLRYAKSDKKRINAAVALGKLHDSRGVKPLVHALVRDKNRVVRAVAAAALGHIGDRRALPALRKAAGDSDASVRKRAKEAVGRIESLSEDRAVASGTMKPATRNNRRTSRLTIAAREAPSHTTTPHVFVAIKSVEDKSEARRSVKARKYYAAKMRGFMRAELSASPTVTSDALRAETLGIRMFSVDVTIVTFHRRVRGPWVEIVCEVRLSVSNKRGRMLSFLTGGATVQVPKRTFKAKFEPQLRREALENAAKSVNQDLLKYLAKETRL